MLVTPLIAKLLTPTDLKQELVSGVQSDNTALSEGGSEWWSDNAALLIGSKCSGCYNSTSGQVECEVRLVARE
jgi:hypothetical protein